MDDPFGSIEKLLPINLLQEIQQSADKKTSSTRNEKFYTHNKILNTKLMTHLKLYKGKKTKKVFGQQNQMLQTLNLRTNF